MKIKKPLFWDIERLSFLSILLLPFTIFIILSNILKKLQNQHNKSEYIKTICVGNIYVGGTGKTPLAIELHRIFKKLRRKTVFIKKFYNESIDEQILLEKEGPCISAKNGRLNALKVAIIKRFNLAIFDDGLQDKSVNYNLRIVCFNKQNFIGNGFLIPAGPLRESIESLKDYDVVFLNGYGNNIKKKISRIKEINKKIKIFETTYRLIKEKKVNKKDKFVAFAGIGTPDNFKKTLNSHGFNITKFLPYPDHYNYSDIEIKKIKQIAKSYKAKILTTEKDFLRIKNNNQLKNNKTNQINFLKMKLEIKNEKKFINYLNSKI
jgi:tetraacyldisaccharide 4'-kinase